MKDLSPLRYFLGIEVAYSPRGYLLSQSKYVEDILEWEIIIDNKIVDNPIEVNAKYCSFNGVPLSRLTFFCIVVGRLVYLTITCLDIAYVVHIVSHFIAFPTKVHWATVQCIFWYLRGTFF